MNLIWGIILVSVTLKCWIGEIIIAFFPKVAVKIRIIENESEVNQTFFSKKHGKAIWDVISLWTLPFTGILLILNNSLWIYFALIGGCIYLYFVGREIASQLKMQPNGINIGITKKLKLKYMILTLWGLMAIITIIMALVTLIL